MNQEVIGVLNWFANKLGMQVDWTTENIMPVAQEMCDKYAHYVIVRSTVCIVVSILCLILLIVASVMIYDYLDEHSFSSIDIPTIPIFIVAGMLLIMVIIVCSVDIARASAIPEIVFIEKLSHLIN